MTDLIKGGFKLIGGVISSGKKKKASKRAEAALTGAIDRSMQNQRQTQDAIEARLEPYDKAGRMGLDMVTQGFKDGSFTDNFEMGDLAGDEGYQFRLNEGQRGLDRTAAARGGLFSGRQLRDTVRFGQGMAMDEYDRARTRFIQDRDAAYGKKMGLASLGYTATSDINRSLADEGAGIRQGFLDTGSVQAQGAAERGAISASAWSNAMRDAGTMTTSLARMFMPGGGGLKSIFKGG